MKYPWFVLGAAAAFSLPNLAGAQSEKDHAAAAARNKLITSVQAELGVPVDGKMGPRTHEAIAEFQRAKGLEPHGQLDLDTVTALGLNGATRSAGVGATSHVRSSDEPTGK